MYDCLGIDDSPSPALNVFLFFPLESWVNSLPSCLYGASSCRWGCCGHGVVMVGGNDESCNPSDYGWYPYPRARVWVSYARRPCACEGRIHCDNYNCGHPQQKSARVRERISEKEVLKQLTLPSNETGI